jgi:hypothetical protein
VPNDPLTAARYPASSANPNVPLDIQNAVNDLSSTTIPRFATTTARDAAYSAWVSAGHSLTTGLFCVVAGQLMEYRGSWQLVVEARLRRLLSTATGTLASGASTNLVAVQTLPASPFGTSVPWMVDYEASIHASGVPSGLGMQLEVLVDGTSFSGSTWTNAGTTGCQMTLTCRDVATFADNATHTLQARVTALAGTITLDAIWGKFLMIVRPYVTF